MLPPMVYFTHLIVYIKSHTYSYRIHTYVACIHHQDIATENEYGIVEKFCGHGTGKYIHMAPLVRRG